MPAGDIFFLTLTWGILHGIFDGEEGIFERTCSAQLYNTCASGTSAEGNRVRGKEGGVKVKKCGTKGAVRVR